MTLNDFNFRAVKVMLIVFNSPDSSKKVSTHLWNNWIRADLKNYDAKETVFQSFPWSCSSEAPSPLWNASVFTLVFHFTSKCAFSLRLTMSNLSSHMLLN